MRTRNASFYTDTESEHARPGSIAHDVEWNRRDVLWHANGRKGLVAAHHPGQLQVSVSDFVAYPDGDLG